MTVQPSTLKATLWMGGWLSLMTIMIVASRTATASLNVFQIMEIRSLIGLIMLAPLVVAAGGLRAMRTASPALHIGRNTAHYAGQAAWLYALTLIPVAELISIEFTLPIWTALLAAAFLGERLSRPRIAAILLGLTGVVMIVRPGANTVDPGHLVILAGAVAFAASIVMVKAMTRGDSAVKIIFWMLVIQSAIGLIPALVVWETPRSETWFALLVLSFCGTFSHYCFARALACADATVVIPVDFLRVPLAAAVGWLVYAEHIDTWVAAGAALILAGNLLNLPWRSAKPIPAERS